MDIKNTTRALTLLTTSLFVTACSQMTVEERLAQAQEAAASQDYKQALVHLKAAVQQSPEDVRPRVELAKIYFEVGDMVSAITTFDKVLTQGGDINDFATEYFLALYSMADLDIFDITFEEFKDKLNPAQRASVEIIVAVIAGRSRDEELVALHLKQARDSAVKSNDNASLQRVEDIQSIIEQYLLAAEKPNTDSLNKVVNRYPKDWLVRSLAAEIQQASGEYQAAADNYIALLELKPYFAQLNLKIAETLLKAKAFDDAEQYIDTVLNISADNPLANQQKAVVALSKQDFKDAARHIDVAIAQNYVTTSSIYIAGISHFQIGNYEQALSYLEKLVDKFPPNHPGLQMYIAAKLTAGDSLDAYTLYERYPSLVESNTRLATKAASALLFAGERGKAADILNNVSDDSFTNPVQKQQLGLLKLTAGDIAGTELIEASSAQIVADAAQGNSYQSKLLLVAIKSGEGDANAARAIIQEWIDAEPDEVSNYLISAQFEKFVGNNAALEPIYSKIQTLSPTNIEAMKYFAEKAFKEGKTQAALEEYMKVLQRLPNDQVALTGAYVAAQAISGSKSEYKKIDSLLAENPKTTPFTTLFAAYLKQDYKQVVALARSSVYGYDTQPRANYLMARAYMALEQPLSAIDVLRGAVKSGFATPTVYEAYFEALMMADGNKAALRAMKNAPEEIAENPQILLLKAHILVNEKRYDDAVAIVYALPEPYASAPQAKEIIGRASSGQQNYTNAIASLEQAYNQAKTPKSAQLLYKALVANGEQEKGLAILEESAAQSRGYDDADLYYVSELAKIHPDKAIRFYEGLIEAQPKNWQAMNNIAWLLSETGQNDSAYKWIMQGLNLRPSNQALLNTKKKIEEALKANK